MLTFVYGESSSVAHTLEFTPFLIALESPFGPMFFAVFSPSTALCGKSDTTYLLFLIGFELLYDCTYQLSTRIWRNVCDYFRQYYNSFGMVGFIFG